MSLRQHAGDVHLSGGELRAEPEHARERLTSLEADRGTSPSRLIGSLARNMLDGVSVVSPEGVHLDVNPALCEMVGLTRAELVGTGLPHLYWPPEEREWTEKNLHEHVDGVSSTVETTFMRKNGERFPVLITPSRICDETGELICIFATIKDVSEQRRAEDALRESEERYRTLAEASLDFIFTIDQRSRVSYVNVRAAASLRREPRELIGAPLSELFDPETAARMQTNLDRVFETDESLEAVAPLSGAWGERWIATWLVPLHDESGSVTSVFGVSRDITEHKHAEQEIRRLNEELERRVVTRTTELDAVNKELEAFAYSVSHDLRAPLRAIDGFSEMVIEDAADRLGDEDLKHLERVRGAAQSMARLIEDILGLSRLARIDMHVEAVDLSGMACDVCEELCSENPHRQVEVSVEPEITVDADPVTLRVILRDLLENAWKFTSKCERAHVEVATTDISGERAIVVRDDGAGFDPRYAEHLFGAFQRLHRADEFEGSGIGLATVQRLVNRHGGRVWATGKVGEGAAFYLTLPERGDVHDRAGTR